MRGTAVPGSAILVIDAGTSALRCHLFDEAGSIVSSSSSPWIFEEFAHDDDAPELARSLDPHAVWRGTCDAVERCLQGRSVAAVAVTSQRQSLAFLDEGGREVYLGPNIDLRAVFEGAELDDVHGPRIYDVTGHAPTFMMAAGKLRWFQLHRPDAYARIATVFSTADWLSWKLSGSVSAERTLAAESGLLDLRSRAWATELYQELGLALEPIREPVRLVDAGEVVGEVSAEVAADTGLAPGVPIVAAGADTQCGLVGLAVHGNDQTGVVAGWSAPVQMVTSAPIISSEGATWAGLYPASDRWVLESSAGDMGNAYRWLKEATMGGGDEAYGQMDELAAAAPLGSGGARTYLGPGRMDVSRLGMSQGGMLFPVPLTLGGYGGGFGRPHLIRSALEGFAFALRANVEQLEEVTGQRSETIAVGGGMTRSSTFLRILADVLGGPLRLGPDPRPTAAGAALFARLALTEYSSLSQAIMSLEPLADTIEPDPLSSSEYTDLYGEWLEAGADLSRMSL